MCDQTVEVELMRWMAKRPESDCDIPRMSSAVLSGQCALVEECECRVAFNYLPRTRQNRGEIVVRRRRKAVEEQPEGMELKQWMMQ
jgi:hypothetical protein